MKNPNAVTYSQSDLDAAFTNAFQNDVKPSKAPEGVTHVMVNSVTGERQFAAQKGKRFYDLVGATFMTAYWSVEYTVSDFLALDVELSDLNKTTTNAAKDLEEPEHSLVLESEYSNGEPLLLPLAEGVVNETVKAVCFKGVNGTLIWIPKKAITKRTGKFSAISSWFKFSDSKAQQYIKDYVCSF